MSRTTKIRAPRIPLRRRISPEFTAAVLSALVLATVGVLGGPSLLASFSAPSPGPVALASPAGSTAVPTPAGSVAAATAAPSPPTTEPPTPTAAPPVSPSPEPTAPPTATPTPVATPVATPTVQPTPVATPTPLPTPPPTTVPTPVSPQVAAVVTLNARLDSIALEMTEAIGSDPDIGAIANGLSRTLVTLDAAKSALNRLPPELAPVAADLATAYGRIATVCEDVLARRKTAVDAYVAGARDVSGLVRDLAPLTARLQGATP